MYSVMRKRLHVRNTKNRNFFGVGLYGVNDNLKFDLESKMC